jgi:hypothetical protein
VLNGFAPILRTGASGEGYGCGARRKTLGGCLPGTRCSRGLVSGPNEFMTNP